MGAGQPRALPEWLMSHLFRELGRLLLTLFNFGFIHALICKTRRPQSRGGTSKAERPRRDHSTPGLLYQRILELRRWKICLKGSGGSWWKWTRLHILTLFAIMNENQTLYIWVIWLDNSRIPALIYSIYHAAICHHAFVDSLFNLLTLEKRMFFILRWMVFTFTDIRLYKSWLMQMC